MSHKTKKTGRNADFVRATITIPAEIAPFIKSQASKPEHAGNLSSYLRSLVLLDRAKCERAA